MPGSPAYLQVREPSAHCPMVRDTEDPSVPASGSPFSDSSAREPDIISEHGTDDNDGSGNGKRGDPFPVERRYQQRIQDRLQTRNQARCHGWYVPDPKRKQDISSADLDHSQRGNGSQSDE